jgi:hypothetical protein
VFLAEPIAALGDHSHPPPLLVAALEDLPHDDIGGAIAGALHDPIVLIFHLGAAIFELPHYLQYPLEDVQGLEASDYDGHPVASADGLVFPAAHGRAHMAGAQKTLDTVVRRPKNRGHGWGDAHLGDEQGEVADAQLSGLPYGHGVGRGGGLEADDEEHHLAVRVGLGDREAV